MTPIEDLVRQALEPTPASSTTTDPVAAIERRVHRARMRLAVGAGVAAVAVAAAIVVPLAAIGGSGEGPTQVISTPTATASPSGDDGSSAVTQWQDETYAVGSSGNSASVWAVERSVDDREHWFLVEQVGTTGEELRRVEINGPGSHVVVDGGRVWVFGGGDGAYPDGIVEVLDVASNEVFVQNFPGTGPYAMAVAEGSAWLTFPRDNRVERLDIVGGDLAVTASVAVSGTPLDVASTGDGSVWVLNDDEALTQISSGPQPQLKATYKWQGRLLGPDQRGSVWASDASGRLVSLTPALLGAGQSVALGYRLSVPGQPAAVMPDGTGGLLVILNGPDANGVAYYADYRRAAFDTGPAAFTWVNNARDVAPDGAGGAVFTANQNEYHWNVVASGAGR